MTHLCDVAGHVFWPDSVILCDPQVCSIDHLTTSGQVTVSYLLALAGGHDCVLVLGSGH